MSFIHVAATASALLCLTTALFQFGLAAGLPYGRAVFGGRAPETNGVLTPGFRAIAAASAVILVSFAWFICTRSGLLQPGIVSDVVIVRAAWLIAVFLLLNSVANAFARHPLERRIFGSASLVAGGLTMLVAASPSQGSDYYVAWTLRTDGAIYGSPAYAGGVIYAGSEDGHLYAIAARRGRELWRFDTGAAIASTPAVADGVIYALNRLGELHAVDAAGRARWTFGTEFEDRLDFWDFYLSDPLIHGDLIIFGSGDRHVYALDRATGRERWRFLTGGIVHAAPVADSTHVYIGGFDGVLYALSLEDGSPSWTFATEGNEHFPLGELQRGPALRDGVLYVGSRDYHLYAVDAASGELRWRLREGAGWIIATPLVDADYLYFGASDGQRLYAVHRDRGEVRWSVPVQTRIFGTAVRASGLLLVGGFNGKLLALDPVTGETRWTFQTPASAAHFATVYDSAGSLNAEMRDLYRSGRGRTAEERILTLGSIAGTPVVAGQSAFFGTTEGVVYGLRLRTH